jgi:hypothetical protein
VTFGHYVICCNYHFNIEQIIAFQWKDMWFPRQPQLALQTRRTAMKRLIMSLMLAAVSFTHMSFAASSMLDQAAITQQAPVTVTTGSHRSMV